MVDIVSAIFLTLIASVIISYLPILFYLFKSKIKPYEELKVNYNVAYIIFVVCVLVLSAIFFTSLAQEKNKKADNGTEST